MTTKIKPDLDCEECKGKGVISIPYESWGEDLTKEYYCECVTTQLSKEKLELKDEINLDLSEQ
ncbi:MAG: hypothetical protein GY786_23315 [Proteobacteria bacterium]|nr:hypothetical protein [Pseudomonadota bacterium]